MLNGDIIICTTLKKNLMTNQYQATADNLIALCNLGNMDNSLHRTIWSKLDAHTDLLDLAEICTALSVAAKTHGTLGCRSYIHCILELNVGPCLEPLLNIGKTEEFDILVEHMSEEQAFEVFDCTIENQHWKGALFVFSQHMSIEDWTGYEKRSSIRHLIARTLKNMDCVDLSNDPRSDLIAELERRALHTTLKEFVGDAPTALRKKM